MLLPAYCEDDQGGPVSKEEALALVRKMQHRYGQILFDTAQEAANGGDVLRTYDHASGNSDALSWCADLIERIEENNSTP